MRTRHSWALSGPSPAKQVAIMTTLAVSATEEKLASQLSRWWDIESYASNCDLTVQLRDKRRAMGSGSLEFRLHYLKSSQDV